MASGLNHTLLVNDLYGKVLRALEGGVFFGGYLKGKSATRIHREVLKF